MKGASNVSRFKDCIDEHGVLIKPDNWQTARSGDRVGVMVSVEAKQAAMNSLVHLAGFGWTNEKICGQYIMRKE